MIRLYTRHNLVENRPKTVNLGADRGMGRFLLVRMSETHFGLDGYLLTIDIRTGEVSEYNISYRV